MSDAITGNTGTTNCRTLVNTGTLMEHQNTSRTYEHWWINGTLVEQLDYHRIVE